MSVSHDEAESDLSMRAQAVLLTDGEEDTREPAAWHGGMSFAVSLLSPFGVSASRFVNAGEEVKQYLIESMIADERHRALRSAVLSLIVGLGVAAFLTQPWLLAALGGVALKAGLDLGRFASRKRWLLRALQLEEADLELIEPSKVGA